MTTATATVTAQELEMNVLKSKILELQSALFYTESVSLVKLPTHVISDVEVDTEGRIWFAVPRPAMHIDAFEKEVPAKLDFFRKGKDFFVKVRGAAVLLTDARTINSYESVSADMRKKMSEEGSMGIMVKMEKTELVDNSPKSAQSWLQSSRSHLSSWFF
jgi:hypothetical protein